MYLKWRYFCLLAYIIYPWVLVKQLCVANKSVLQIGSKEWGRETHPCHLLSNIVRLWGLSNFRRHRNPTFPGDAILVQSVNIFSFILLVLALVIICFYTLILNVLWFSVNKIKILKENCHFKIIANIGSSKLTWSPAFLAINTRVIFVVRIE